MSRDEKLPPHLAGLIHSEFAVWRWFVLRGAGFPVRLISELDATACTLLAAEDELVRLYEEAIGALKKVGDALKASGENLKTERSKGLAKALRALRARRMPAITDAGKPFELLVAAISRAEAELKRTRNDYAAEFQKGVLGQSEALQKLLRDPRFQEAVLWQNRHAFETGVLPILQESQPDVRKASKRRRHEELAANYLQRYSVKNDTIGFYGPVCWGYISDEGNSIEAMPGPSFLKARTSYFESWAIDKLATCLSQKPGIEWWIAPSMHPHFGIQGTSSNCQTVNQRL